MTIGPTTHIISSSASRPIHSAIERVSQEIGRRFTPPDDPGEREEDKPASSQEARETREEESRLPGSKQMSWKKAFELIDEITGTSQEAAQGILAEIGIEMEQFPSAQHLASWAGVCPGNHESAGKRLSGKTKPRQSLAASTSHAGCPCRWSQ
jgi:hypothetical protein